MDALRLVAGSAPGHFDLAAIDQPPTATSFQIVAPPGIFYVR